MNAPTYINSTHRALARNPGGLTLEEIAGKIRAKAKKAAEQVRELHDLGMIQTTEEAGQPVYKLDEQAAAAPVCDLVQTEGESQAAPLTISDSEGGETDAPAAANRALGEQLEAAKVELDKAFRRDIMLSQTIYNHILAMSAAVIEWETGKRETAMLWIENTLIGPGLYPDFEEAKALGGAQAWFDFQIKEERDRLRGIANETDLSNHIKNSILAHLETDALTAQIEHLRAELAERDSHLHKITSDTGRSDIAQRLIDHNDDRLYHEADMLMYEASDAITMLEHERDQLRAELETARAEAIAIKTLEGAMPGFGAAHDAQRIASLTAELQALRTCSANAINEADRLRAELAKASIELVKNVSGYLVCATKRKPRRINDGERAKFAALAAVRAGAARAEVLAVVPVGTARRGAEWRAK